MKNRRFQYQYRKNASKLHRAVGDLLREEKPFGDFEFYQEYPVNKVNPNYKNSRHHFDWVCPQLRIVIECHGKQHEVVCNFGGSVDDAVENFHLGKERDYKKEQAAKEAGYTYLVIPYNVKNLSSSFLVNLFASGKKDANSHPLPIQVPKNTIRATMIVKNKEIRKNYLASDRHKQELQKAREYRKQQYQRLKELKERSN
jgi:very-short-patch-repair endonuclease